MEEKKKRWRPSLTAYRELEAKLESQIDGTSQLVKDCDAWREKYRKLKVKFDDEHFASVHLHKEYNDLKAERDTLEKSNKLMEDELNRLRAINDKLSKKCVDRDDQIEALKNRGFWARVFNKDV